MIRVKQFTANSLTGLEDLAKEWLRGISVGARVMHQKWSIETLGGGFSGAYEVILKIEEPTKIGSVVYYRGIDWSGHVVKVSETQWIDVEGGTDGLEGVSTISWDTAVADVEISLTPWGDQS